MNIDNIHQLLDRYMEGENTQEELSILKKFFKECNNLPDDLLPYRDMFDILETPLPVPTDKELEAFCKVNNVEAICGEKDNLQKGTTKVELKPKINWWKYVGIAAVLAIVFLFSSKVAFDSNDEINVVAQKKHVKKKDANKSINETKRDTVMNPLKSERAIQRTPRYDMANANANRRQNLDYHTEEVQDIEETVDVAEASDTFNEEEMRKLIANLQKRQGFSLSELEKEIKEKGEAFTNDVYKEIASSTDY